MDQSEFSVADAMRNLNASVAAESTAPLFPPLLQSLLIFFSLLQSCRFFTHLLLTLSTIQKRPASSLLLDLNLEPLPPFYLALCINFHEFLVLLLCLPLAMEFSIVDWTHPDICTDLHKVDELMVLKVDGSPNTNGCSISDKVHMKHKKITCCVMVLSLQGKRWSFH